VVPLVLRGYEHYYCARVGAGVLGGAAKWVGYVLIGIRNGVCVEIRARYDGISVAHYPVEKLDVRPEALRPGGVR